MSPGLWSDAMPAWSPDGTEIAFGRTMNIPGLWPFVPVRETVPFSIRVADVATGKSREVFRADEGMGSNFHGWNSASQIYWGAGDYIVFPWEKNGWLNLWSVPADGGEAIALTPGEFEVQFGSLTPDRQVPRLRFEPGRHRSEASVAGPHRWEPAATANHLGNGHRMVAG